MWIHDPFSFTYIQISSLNSTICWRCCFCCCCGTFFVKIKYPSVCNFIYIFTLFPLIFSGFIFSQYYAIFYYYVSVRQLEIWDGNNTSIFFILQSYCSFQDFFLLLFLLYIVEDFLFKSCDEFCLKFYGGVHWIYRLLWIVWILWLFSQYKS